MTLYDFPDSEYITDELVAKSLELFDMAEKAESGEVKKRIQRERLAMEYVRITRTSDNDIRAKETDSFALKVKEFKLTEIMERIDLSLSFDFMKREPFARNRDGKYTVYYLVK